MIKTLKSFLPTLTILTLIVFLLSTNRPCKATIVESSKLTLLKTSGPTLRTMEKIMPEIEKNPWYQKLNKEHALLKLITRHDVQNIKSETTSLPKDLVDIIADYLPVYIPAKVDIIVSRADQAFLQIENHPVFGKAIITPDGLEWSYEVEKDKSVDQNGKPKYKLMTYEQARKYCKDKGIAKGFNCDTPTLNHYMNLVTYLGYGTPYGYSWEVFPPLPVMDLSDIDWGSKIWFWTSTIVDDQKEAIIFTGDTSTFLSMTGPSYSENDPTSLRSVRCVCTGREQ